ncbi:TetR/AcrR family transcriptional regulator [Nesterenkonia sp. NBAIMH1]|uniref:TetR/AcrR family transcriptional regulator n=1 Tax=Nesterenkonia sp. NBAIMH1 TaxID=2600320 RepID=UPI0011B5E604|nr:TetR/AcrR family transcriptional regulator [Nesterenkonia sp. NBAIMH1]
MSSDAASAPHPKRRLPRAQRRLQLLECAQQLFVAKGFHAASMDDIAEAAAVSKPVLYQHFPGKHELFLDLLDTHLQELTGELTAALAGEKPNRERVEDTVTAFFTFIAREDEAYRLVFTAGMDHDEAVAARLSQFHSRMATAIAELIVEDTGQPIAEATMIGHGLIGMATQAARHWNRLSERPPMEVSAELAGRLAWKGISGFPKEAPGASRRSAGDPPRP